MFPYTLTGLTAEHFAAARTNIDAKSSGPRPGRFWILLRGRTGGWYDVPLEAMPLLIGVDELDEAVEAALRIPGTAGVIRELNDEERFDAEMMMFMGARR